MMGPIIMPPTPDSGVSIITPSILSSRVPLMTPPTPNAGVDRQGIRVPNPVSEPLMTQVVGGRARSPGPLNIILPQLRNEHPRQSRQLPQAQGAPGAHSPEQQLEQLEQLEQAIVLGQLPPEQFVQALDQMDQVMGQLAESSQPSHHLQQVVQPDQEAINHALDQIRQDVVSATDDFTGSTGRLPTHEQREWRERLFLKLYIIRRFYSATIYAPERNYGLNVVRMMASQYQESLNLSA